MLAEENGFITWSYSKFFVQLLLGINVKASDAAVGKEDKVMEKGGYLLCCLLMLLLVKLVEWFVASCLEWWLINILLTISG